MKLATMNKAYIPYANVCVSARGSGFPRGYRIPNPSDIAWVKHGQDSMIPECVSETKEVHLSATKNLERQQVGVISEWRLQEHTPCISTILVDV